MLASGRHRLAPVIDEQGELQVLITRTGALRSTIYEPCLDANNQLKVAAAIGVNADAVDKAELLVEAGIDYLVIDTAHGHQQRMIDTLKAIRIDAGTG